MESKTNTETKESASLHTNEAKSKKSAFLGGIFMAVVLLGSIFYLGFSGQLKTCFEALKDVNYSFVILCAGFVGGYLLLGGLCYRISVKAATTHKLDYKTDCIIEAAGTFFGNLTPAMAAAFPVQLWKLFQTGLDLGEASAVQMVRFGTYTLVSSFLGLFLLIFTWPYFSAHYPEAVWLNVVLIVLKCGQVALLVLASLFPHFVIRVAQKLLSLFSKLGFKKASEKGDEWLAQLSKQVGLYAEAFRSVIKNVRALILLLFATLLQVLLFYATPFIILLAFGKAPFFFVALTAGTMVQFLASTIPLPGGTGGIEASFAVFFGPLFGSLEATAGYLVWRLVTYYGYTIFCGIVSMIPVKRIS